MSNQVVTIGYLKTFVNGVISVNTTKSDSYCPTYAELTGGTLVQNYSAGTNPTNHKPGIRIPSCTVGVGYTNNQLVIRQDLQLLWYVLQSVDVSASPTTISCCGGSSTLSTTAYFNLSTKKENGITSASTNTSTVITASYSDDKSYTTISGNKITFSKNSVNYPSSTSAAARSTTVTSTYEYSGITKTDTVSITQNSNSVGSWTWISDTTTSISVSPASMSFESGGGSKSYSVTRYYTSYYERYDSCNTLMDTDTDSNSASVTPTSYNCTGGFTCTSSKVSCDTNTGSSRTGTLTVTWGGFSDTCSLSQGASQAGTTNGEPYNYDYYLSVSTPSGKISCDGGSATFTARYVTTWDYDWETKNDAGEVTNSGTSSDSSSTNVTNSAEWSTTVGSVSKGTLTLGAYDEDTRRTATVTAKYNGYSDSDYVYQESCAPDTPTGSTVTSTTYTYRIDAADFDACDSETTVTVYATPTYYYSDGSNAKGEETEISVFPLPTITYRLGTGETTVTASQNSTSGSRIWTVTASFRHNNSNQTASDTATQSAGPCNTGSTASTCMNIEYSVPVALSSSVIVSFKDSSGAIIAAHTVPSTTGTTTKEICGLTNGKALTASCSDDTVTMSGGINFNFSAGTTEYITIQAPNSGPTGSTVYQYSFKNCYSDRQLGLFASNATPSGSHLQFAMLSALDGTAATVLVNSNTGTLVNGSSSNSSSSAKIGDSVKVYSVTNTTNIWTLEETITLTAEDRSFEYGNCTSCTCKVTSIKAEPSAHTFTSEEDYEFTITIVDDNCASCTDQFDVYENNIWVKGGSGTISLPNKTTTYVVKASDDTSKQCTINTTKYSSEDVYEFYFTENDGETTWDRYDPFPSSGVTGTDPYFITSLKNDSEQSYSVSSNQTWLTYENSDSSYVMPIVAENTTSSERSGTLTLTQSGSDKKLYIKISQNAYSITKTSIKVQSVSVTTNGGASSSNYGGYVTVSLNKPIEHGELTVRVGFNYECDNDGNSYSETFSFNSTNKQTIIDGYFAQNCYYQDLCVNKPLTAFTFISSTDEFDKYYTFDSTTPTMTVDKNCSDVPTPTPCTCSVTSISVSPTAHTFTSDSSKSFSVTINDNDCSGCTNQFLVYNSSGTYVTSGTSSFSLSNQSGTFTIRAKDNTGKTCTLTTTKYTAPVYVFKFNNPTGGFDSTSTETHIIHNTNYEPIGPTTTLTSTKDGSNVGYTMSSNVNWITTSTASTTCSWNISKNTSTSSRSGTITLTQSGSNKTLTISVIQGGAPATKTCNPLFLSYDDASHKMTATFDEMVSSDVTINFKVNINNSAIITDSIKISEGNNSNTKTLSTSQSITSTAGTSISISSINPSSDSEYEYNCDTDWEIIPSTPVDPCVNATVKLKSSNTFGDSNLNSSVVHNICPDDNFISASGNFYYGFGYMGHNHTFDIEFSIEQVGASIQTIECSTDSGNHSGEGSFGFTYSGINPDLLFQDGGVMTISGTYTFNDRTSNLQTGNYLITITLIEI